jgi:hypothetical protein
MAEKEVPLYFGEGPGRQEIGIAKIEGGQINCVIFDEALRRDLSIHSGDWSIGVLPGAFSLTPIPVVDASERDLKNPIYKEK